MSRKFKKNETKDNMKIANTVNLNDEADEDSTTPEEGSRGDLDSDGVTIEYTDEPEQKSSGEKEQSTLLRTLGHKPRGIKFVKVDANKKKVCSKGCGARQGDAYMLLL